MNKTIFDQVYKKYHARDYFGNKSIIRDKLKYAKENNITVKYSDVKNYLIFQKEKCYNFMINRENEYIKTDIKVPQREKFTYTLFRKLGIY